VRYTGIGVEIERDRSKTWLALAGAGDDGKVYVDLLPALEGTDAVDAITTLWSQHPIEGIGIDPRSAAATLLDGLKNEGMPVQPADASAMSIAFGRLIDWTTSGRLRHRGDRALTEAVRQAAAKRSTSGCSGCRSWCARRSCAASGVGIGGVGTRGRRARHAACCVLLAHFLFSICLQCMYGTRHCGACAGGYRPSA
jgi:hypothetical protein